MPSFSYLGSTMRLFVAILFFLSSAVSWAAGITSKTADFIIYKNSLGSSTIKIPDWELVVDGDSLAGKKNLPVPKSNTSFNATLPLPRNKLLSNLGKLARLNPYLLVAQGLIDLYYDEITKEFMIEKTPSSDPSGSCGGEFAGFVQQCFGGVLVHYTAVNPSSVRVDFHLPGNPDSIITGRLQIRGVYDLSIRQTVHFVDVYRDGSVVCSYPYDTPGGFNSLRGVSQFPVICDARNQPQPQPQLEPATETDIVQNLDKNLTADKLPLVRDLVKSQGWQLETDNVPTVTGPSEVVISTSTRTRQNPDGTTTTERVVEKNVYTYNNNVITENHVTQIFYGDQLVENNVTEINNETNSEPVDYTFQPPTGEYPTDLEIPEKRDLVAEVLNPVASQLEGFGSKIGLRGSGQCSFDIPFSLGRASGSGRLDFCQYQSTFSTVGSMLVAFAYLMAGLIVLGMRH